MIKKYAKRKVLKLENSLSTGTVYYGLHMSEGLAHYKPPGEEEFTVFVGNETIKLMNQSFAGKPVHVGHIDEHAQLGDADGIVSESFYNPVDGKHWCKFIVFTQKGLDAINRGWQLSNCLRVNACSPGGEWHGLTFDKTVDKGTFHHLAIVPNPRYGESIILTPEQYKQYNNQKKVELEMLSNSKETPMFKLFKNEAQDEKETKKLLNMSVHLPKTKRTVTVEQLCNEADEKKEEKVENSEDQEIDVDGAKMTLKAFIEMYKKLKAEFDSLEIVGEEVIENEEETDEEKLSNSNDDIEDEDDEDDEILDEDDLDAFDAKEAAEEAAEAEKLKNAKETPAKKQAIKKGSNISKLKNAAERADKKLSNSKPFVVDLSSDQVKRGQERYGAKKK